MIRRRLHWLLIWLQAWTLVLGLILKDNSSSICGSLPLVGFCDCGAPKEERFNDPDCWRDQAMYRAEFVALLLFLTFAGLTFAGHDPCNLSDGSWALIICRIVQHTLTIPALMFLLIFVPNDAFWVYGYIAAAGAGIWQILQAILFIDFSYDFNTRVIKLAQDSRRVYIDVRREKVIKGMAVAFSGVLILAVLVALGILSRGRPDLLAFFLGVSLVMLILTFLSILERIKHGALLTSALLFAYVGWQSWEVSANFPSDHLERPDASLGVGLAFGMLVYYGVSYGFGSRISGENEAHRRETVAANSQIGIDTTPFASTPTVELNQDFAIRCLIHAAATAYVCSKMAMYRGVFRGCVSMVVVMTTVLLYGWTLIAPSVLPSRSFPG